MDFLINKIKPICILAAAIVVFGYLLKRLVIWMAFPCQFCHARVTFFKRMPHADQEAILNYFRSHESREPDRNGIFVCQNCRTVHDDFSGEKKSMEIDDYGCTVFCKRCNALMTYSDPDNPNIVCSRCGTRYKWEVDEASNYRFLMPPASTKVLDKCSSGPDDIYRRRYENGF